MSEPSKVYHSSRPHSYEHGSSYENKYRQYGGKQQQQYYNDQKGYASDIMPVMSSSDQSFTSLRYGDRITSNRVQPTSSSSQSNSPTRLNQRVRVRTRTISRPVPQPQPPMMELPPLNSYQPEPPITRSPQYNLAKIAFVPIKQSDIDDISSQAYQNQQSGGSSESPSDYSLPESLVNYIKEVQKTQPREPNDSEKPKSPEQTGSLEPAVTVISSNENINQPSTFTEQPSLDQVNHNSISNQDYNPSSTLPPSIQNSWESYFANQPAQPQYTAQYNPSEYQYKPPELKVMTNLPRYQEPEQPLNKPSGVFRLNNMTPYKPQTVPAGVSQPHVTQFLYQVSHSDTTLPTHQLSSQFGNYPTYENFGLETYRQREKMRTSPSNTVETWIRPNHTTKSSLWSGFRKRVAKLF